jgi:hypothetical protein
LTSVTDLLDDAAALSERPGHAALRALGERLRDYRVDPRDIEAVRTGEPRRFLARHDAGPLIALRWYEPGYVSTVHSHSWTVLVGLAGSGTLERFELADGKARLVSTEPTDPPNVAVLDGAEIHRQRASGEGALELVLIGDYDPDSPHREYAT